ncbi:MAG: superinfection immunity protein [Candidatus Binataceae bacterium]
MDTTKTFEIIAMVATTYLAPSAVAMLRKSASIQQIFMLNVWLGWTLVGWFTALQWALDPEGK